MKGLEPLWFPTVPWQQSQGELGITAMGPEQLQPQQAAQNPCGETASQAGAWWGTASSGQGCGDWGAGRDAVGQKKHFAAVLAVGCLVPGA